MIKIKLTGNIKKELEEAVAKAKQKTIEEIVEDLKAATPVDTGEARDSWRREGNHIINDAPHIESLNAGSSIQASPYFIEKTILSNTDVVPNGIIVRSK